MASLYLIKHSMPEKVADRPAREWLLGDEGRALAARLGERLAGLGIARLVSSVEPKARETAEVMGARLGLAVTAEEGLHEHERERVPLFRDPSVLDAAVRDMFARPGEVVFGDESADQAHDRYAAAMHRVIGDGSDSIAVVSHGTVMALFVARQGGLDPFPLWKSLGLPSCVTLSLPELRMVEVIQTPG